MVAPVRGGIEEGSSATADALGRRKREDSQETQDERNVRIARSILNDHPIPPPRTASYVDFLEGMTPDRARRQEEGKLLYDQVFQGLNEALTKEPNDADLLYARGVLLYTGHCQGRFSIETLREGVIDLERALRKTSSMLLREDAGVWWNKAKGRYVAHQLSLGMSALDKSHYELAKDYFVSAAEFDPTATKYFVDHMAAVGRFSFEKKCYEQAGYFVRLALEASTRSPDANGPLFKLYMEAKEKLEEAAKWKQAESKPQASPTINVDS